MSADGNYVVFASEASNLVAGDTNGVADVFRRDLKSGVTTLVSVSTAGAKADEWSDEPVVSADGRYVAFVSYASNLVAGDTNEVGDVFLRDMTAGVTTRLSVSSSGAQATGDSGYMSGPATLSMSDDGRYVAFGSDASNLVAGDTNGAWDLFVRDTQNNTTTRVSVSTGSGQADNMSAEPALTADGTHIAFWSEASNLVAGDTNDVPDVFVRDLVTSVTTRVSVGASGAQGTEESSEAAISADGRYVAFSSFAPNLVAGDTNKDWDVFVRDTQTATTTRVSVATSGAQANSGSGEVAMSANGRYIVFTTAASNLFAGDFNQSLDVVVRDLTAGSTGLVSARLDGTQAEYESFLGSISADGGVISFTSYASNLVAGDTNEDSDVFVARKQ